MRDFVFLLGFFLAAAFFALVGVAVMVPSPMLLDAVLRASLPMLGVALVLVVVLVTAPVRR